MNWLVVAHSFHPSSKETEQVDLHEFKVGLDYTESSSTTRAVTQRNPVMRYLKKKIKEI